jgi:hypothetical protein
MAVIDIITWLACSFGLALFGFFVGRCARKLPIIDDRLPWALSRDQTMHANEDQQRACEHPSGKPRWPSDPE